ncbi:hypothetical protein K439DRAFT_560431 [Ramaria rubella]|nr:hypothetical protein K439DRAFT_560431 [Ramaria rubella]
MYLFVTLWGVVAFTGKLQVPQTLRARIVAADALAPTMSSLSPFLRHTRSPTARMGGIYISRFEERHGDMCLSQV